MEKEGRTFPIWETINGQVVAKANHYAIGGRGPNRWIVKDDVIRGYERVFAQQCRIYAGRHISGRFKLSIKVYDRHVRYDLDNALKTILDCLQYVGAITDDKNCFTIEAHKFVDKYHPRIEYRIEEYNTQTSMF